MEELQLQVRAEMGPCLVVWVLPAVPLSSGLSKRRKKGRWRPQEHKLAAATRVIPLNLDAFPSCVARFVQETADLVAGNGFFLLLGVVLPWNLWFVELR